MFRDPNQDDRVWVIFVWDLDGWQSFASEPDVPADHAGGRAQGPAAGAGAQGRRDRRPDGPLSIMGGAEANVATMALDEINASGGLLGRRVELVIEDSATDDALRRPPPTKLVQGDHVDVLLGGIFSSTRQAIKTPAVVEGETL